MPRGDRTGPLGEGPKTGRQMGFCVGNEHPGFATLHSNWRSGYGSGFRGGYGNYFPGSLTDVSEKTMIENEIGFSKINYPLWKINFPKLKRNDGK